MIAIHAFVSGKVQGVWFRQNTYKVAQQLGLTGWVRNIPDGRVELVACGEQTQIDQLTEWLWQGPPLAKVQEVIIEEWTVEKFSGFEVR